jgi:hypothetical protein
MTSKIKNIIIFTVVAVILFLIYIFFVKPAPEEQNLVSSSTINTVTTDTDTLGQNSAIAKDFLSILLNVKNIRLDENIFSHKSFTSLRDSSIPITAPTPEEEGRVNPFAPIGSDVVVPPPTPVCVLPEVLDTTTKTCAIPEITCILPQVLDEITNTCITPAPTCTLPKVLNTTTNTCVTPVTCKLPKVLNEATNTCVTPVVCTSPKVLDTKTNTCVAPTPAP